MSDSHDIPGAGRNGNVPPIEYRWPKGTSGNPAGRAPNAGSTAREYVNQLVVDRIKEPELRRIARDAEEEPAKRAAAVRVLRWMELPDLADFEPLLDGQLSLRELRSQGVDTGSIKKVKTRRKVLRKPDGDIEGEEVEREVELYDRSGEDFDRVCDRTDGRPTQRLDVKNDTDNLQPGDGAIAADRLLLELRRDLGLAGEPGDPAGSETPA
jgi:hypothetical protein